MRLAIGTLTVLLGHSVALAEDVAPSRAEIQVAEAPSPAPARQKVPIRVVRILSETNQALVYDRTGGGTHLLVGVGDKVGIYTVEAIDEDEVTLSANDKQIVLAAPDRPWRRRNSEEKPRAVRGGAPAPADPYGGEPAPADPYQAPSNGGPAPADPYQAPSNGGPAPADPYQAPSSGGPAPADPYQAPSSGGPAPTDPYAQELREVRAPSRPDPVPAPVATLPPTPSPAVTPAPATPAADPILARREVDAVLADFSALTVAFRATFTPAGVKVDSILDGSLFSKAGLRAGDVIASVDGKPLRSLDDVAALYARAGSLRTVTAQVVRGGKPLTLRAVIQ